MSLAVPAPGSESDPARLVVDGKAAAASALIASLQAQGFTHLLTITKHRAPARLHFVGNTFGSGNLQGIGFYVDNDNRTARRDTGETGKGFMAPFVHIKITLGACRPGFASVAGRGDDHGECRALRGAQQ